MAENICMILFSFKSFCICSKKTKDKWVDHTFTKPKGKFFMEFTLSSIDLRKCNRYSIMIVNKLHDWWQMGTDRCEQKWWTKLDKLFVLIYFYMCCKKFVVVSVELLCKLPHMKTKSSLYTSNVHLDFRGKICEKKVQHYAQVNTRPTEFVQ